MSEKTVRFLLRCTFWLSVVYASIFWRGSLAARPDLQADALAAIRSVALGSTQKVTSELTGYCGRQVAECARDALRLTALVETTGAGHGPGPAARRIHEAGTPRAH